MTTTIPQSAAVDRMLAGERLEAFIEQVCRGWKRDPTAAELEQMALYFQAGRYNPWARPPQLIFTSRYDGTLRKEVMTPQKTLDGYRLDGYRSKEIVTQIGPEWCGADGVWRDVWLRSEYPRAARFGIQKRGASQVSWSVALWDEWVQLVDVYEGKGDNRRKTGEKTVAQFWDAKPAHMLGKTAEIMSLKRALPAETDPLAIEHQRELERLAIAGQSASYARTFGTSDHSPFDLPEPTLRREVLDAPRPVASASLPPPSDQAPASRRQRELGDLYAEYGRLLAEARFAGVVPEGEVPRWMLPQGATRELVIERGTALRLALNAQSGARPADVDDDEADSVAEVLGASELDDYTEAAPTTPPVQPAADSPSAQPDLRSSSARSREEVRRELTQVRAKARELGIAMIPLGHDASVDVVEKAILDIRAQIAAAERALVNQEPEQEQLPS